MERTGRPSARDRARQTLGMDPGAMDVERAKEALRRAETRIRIAKRQGA